ncbi:MAG: DUF3800 domain-containing protein [Patescibacteria group bacterium]|nr:DUF3800 domain-containing protein [Patescibacteria group bacterium]
MSTSEKIFCYVDETGQDTLGKFFIVSVVITKNNREKIAKLLVEIEQETGKKSTKWLKTKKELKIAYLKKVLENKIFKKTIYYSITKETKTYRDTTIVAIASAINDTKCQEKYKASVFIDGLKKSEVRVVGVGLRQIGIRIEKVRGIKDESSSIIRLADAIAGLVRKNNEGVDYAVELYRLGAKQGVLRKLK